ncbi:MAG: tetratricopeptide repeat protein [Ignavibacteria bacterium]|nr:tetratricopeptide repeat protein [Ignavibacteria bacterium]
MNNDHVQEQLDGAIEKLIKAHYIFITYEYDESERLAMSALETLLQLEKLQDIVDELDPNSVKYNVIYQIAHAYNRLNVIASSRYDFASGLEYASMSITYSERIRNYNRISNLYSNIAGMYSELGEDDRAIEYARKALAISREHGTAESIVNALSNIGEGYRRIADYNASLVHSHEALALLEENSLLNYKCMVTGNIGVTYLDSGDYPQSLEYLSKALQVSIDTQDKRLEGLWFGFLGQLYSTEQFDGYDDDKAIEFLQRSLTIIRELDIHAFEFRNSYKLLTALYKKKGDTAKALEALEKYVELEHEVKSVEARKEATRFDYEHKTAEREKTLVIERAAAAAELKATTTVLHKVLPPSIADRLIAGELDIADNFASVSILFADIVGFTPISARMPAAIVVRFLNYVFGTFDVIMKKYGCEKIKTIGDGYMAVAGAPIECADHAESMARAALEMQKDIRLPEEFKEYLPVGTKFGLRIGLHTGSVVGGVIGDERFVYDIYSDSVNTAARMESHGEPGKIHVSEDFAFHLQNRMDMIDDDLGEIIFEERGEIEIKGKGWMKTYFMVKNV